MAFRSFKIRLAGRLLFTGLALFALFWLILRPGLHGLSLVAAAVFLLLAFDIWRFISRTNREVTRFLDAARFADFSQRFSLAGMGSGFDQLGETFNDILDGQRRQRAERELALRQLRALIEHVPVPLLTVHGDNSITLQNNAARRLFGTARVTLLEDLGKFGESFRLAVSEAIPGQRELVTFSVDDIEYQLTLATTEIMVEADRQRLISLQDIQSELDETQALAWRELVLVLTHEIMNSITPITSLSRTANDVVGDILEKAVADSRPVEDLEDLRDAVATVAKRSDGLMQFVESYRQITRLAPPKKRRILISELFEAVCRLASAEWAQQDAELTREITPSTLDVYADRDLLEPVLLNLLRNSRQATAGQAKPVIRLHAGLNRRGHVVMEVSDNGPGVPEEIARKIFVPFFTTKEGGSGVGLALARQVMIAHGGFIRVARNEQGGATFTLTF